MLEKTTLGLIAVGAIPFALVQWLFLFLLRLVCIVVGLPVVALAVLSPQSGISVSDGRAIVNLRRWAWLWGNDFDGLDGDKRGWWAENCDALVLFGLRPLLRRVGVSMPELEVTSWLARWWWAAVRNPANNMRLLALFSCPVSECEISAVGDDLVEDKLGGSGWQFVCAMRSPLVFPYDVWFGFYLVRQLTATRAFVVRLGFKIRPDHAFAAGEPAKGLTFKLNPWKEI